MIDNRDFMYIIDRENKERTIWKCRLKNAMNCKARATTIDNCIIKFFSTHNHDVETQRQKLCEYERKALNLGPNKK